MIGLKSSLIVDCLAAALGFTEGYFREPMDISKPDCLSRLRLLHYPASENATGTWRAGSHTDVGCLTLLFQQDEGDGLEICPGRESSTSNAIGDNFFPLPAKTGPIVVNIGDMLSEPVILSLVEFTDDFSVLVRRSPQGDLS